MKLTIEFDVPFSECAKCIALDPVVERTDWQVDDNLNLKCDTRYYCKGEIFCKRREGADDGD